MMILFTTVHVMVALFLIVVVLLQTGKRADLAGAFGGGGSQTAFGARGAVSVLSKATTMAAIMFMVTSMGLAVLSSRTRTAGGASVLDQISPQSADVPADSDNPLSGSAGSDETPTEEPEPLATDDPGDVEEPAVPSETTAPESN
jgi:preprotein translocase subunit SecG